MVGLEDGSKGGTYKHGVRRDGGLPGLGLSWSPHCLALALPYVWVGRPSTSELCQGTILPLSGSEQQEGHPGRPLLLTQKVKDGGSP